jgi:hypothetical protein
MTEKTDYGAVSDEQIARYGITLRVPRSVIDADINAVARALGLLKESAPYGHGGRALIDGYCRGTRCIHIAMSEWQWGHPDYQLILTRMELERQLKAEFEASVATLSMAQRLRGWMP